MSDRLIYVPLFPAGCTQCRWTDRVEIPLGTDVWNVYRLLWKAHLEMSPICHHKFGAQYVCTVTPELELPGVGSRGNARA